MIQEPGGWESGEGPSQKADVGESQDTIQAAETQSAWKGEGSRHSGGRFPRAGVVRRCACVEGAGKMIGAFGIGRNIAACLEHLGKNHMTVYFKNFKS